MRTGGWTTNEGLLLAIDLVVLLLGDVTVVQGGNECAVGKGDCACAVGPDRYVVAQNSPRTVEVARANLSVRAPCDVTNPSSRLAREGCTFKKSCWDQFFHCRRNFKDAARLAALRSHSAASLRVGPLLRRNRQSGLRGRY